MGHWMCRNLPKIKTDPDGLIGGKVAAQVTLLVTSTGVQIDIDVVLVGAAPGLEEAIGTRLREPATELGRAFARTLQAVQAEHRRTQSPDTPPDATAH